MKHQPSGYAVRGVALSVVNTLVEVSWKLAPLKTISSGLLCSPDNPAKSWWI